ncbi:MAG: DUF4003 family protein [Clostridia bacterium]|nr:DUF4003 family protein [Clostridia bacterium]
MQSGTMRRTEQFMENRRRIERTFRMSTPQVHCLCALLLGIDDRDADLESIRRGKKILKKNTGIFSAFRGLGMAPAAIKIGEYEDGAQRLDYAKDNLKKLRAAGFIPTDYLCPAAFLMAKYHDRADAVAKLAREHYLEMRHAHRVLTGGEDVMFAVLFAMYGAEKDALSARMDAAMDLLSGRFGRTNPAQMASFAIAFSDQPADELALKTERLYDAVRQAGEKNREMLDLPLLAFLAGLDVPEKETAALIVELSAYLREQKGFSPMRIGRSQRLVYATALAAIDALLNAPLKKEDFAKKRDLLQTLLMSGILLFVVVSMAASAH